MDETGGPFLFFEVAFNIERDAFVSTSLISETLHMDHTLRFLSGSRKLNEWTQQAWWSLWHLKRSHATRFQLVVAMKVFQTSTFKIEAENPGFDMNHHDSVLKNYADQVNCSSKSLGFGSWPLADEVIVHGSRRNCVPRPRALNLVSD